MSFIIYVNMSGNKCSIYVSADSCSKALDEFMKNHSYIGCIVEGIQRIEDLKQEEKNEL